MSITEIVLRYRCDKAAVIFMVNRYRLSQRYRRASGQWRQPSQWRSSRWAMRLSAPFPLGGLETQAASCRAA